MSEPVQQLNCDQARALIRAFSVGTLAPGARAALDRHLVGCQDCRLAYRSTIDSAAELARSLVRERETGALSGAAETTPGKRMRGRSRAFTFVAIALVLASIPMLAPEGTEVRARCLEGQGWIGETLLAAGAAGTTGASVDRGTWVEAQAGSRVELSAGDARVELAGTALVMVESGDGLCVRLSRGIVTVTGAARVTSPLGVFDLQSGRAELRLEPSRMIARCLEGCGSLVGPLGEQSLAAGESWALDWTKGLTAMR